MNSKHIALAIVLLTACSTVAPADPLGSAFTYQSRLTISGTNATGLYDFQFVLCDAVTAGVTLGTTNVEAVPVSSGVYAVALNFGASAFDGNARWLALSVRTNGGIAWTALSPRLALTPTPYAIASGKVTGSVAAGQLTGSIPPTSIGAGTITSTMLAAASVTSNQLAAGSVTTSSLANNGVSSAKLAFDPASLNKVSGTVMTSSGGNVGIGTTGPTSKLTVDGGWLEMLSGNSIQLRPSGNAWDYRLTAEGRSLNICSGGSPSTPFFSITGGGNIGIGTTGPEAALHILAADGTQPLLKLKTPGNYQSSMLWIEDEDLYVTNRALATMDLTTGSGLFNIVGGAYNDENIYKYASVRGASRIGLHDNTINMFVSSLSRDGGQAAGTNVTFYQTLSLSDAKFIVYTGSGAERLRVDTNGNVGIGTATPQAKLHVNGSAIISGTNTVKVLSITGGADMAEPFTISGNTVPQGAVVVIDDQHPGQLKLSERAYDKRVAGIVSGAGGVQPGLTLSQQGVLAGGQNVALSGRVYVQADATAVPIQPGDLLTTAALPGHAMKVTDYAQAQGAILGKAMSRLESGRGLVLVLVTLQ